ncbi:MAG: glycosyltransferase family 4 protein [Xenococcaceae cyanobacterium]
MKKNKKRPKVSIVVSDLSSSGAGRWGGAVRPFLLAQALKKIDCDVQILGIAYDRDTTHLTDLDVSIIAFPCKHHSGFFRAANRLLKKIDGDIIYAVKPKPTSFGLALAKKLVTRRPLILDIDDWELSWHGGDRFQYQPSLKQFAREIFKPDGALRHPDHPLYLRWLESFIDRTDVITTHNRFLQQRFGGVYVPNGKDTNLFSPEKYDPETSRQKYGLAGYRVLMFPGAPRPYKGLEDVLMALEKLAQPDLRLAIVGGSPYDNYDRQLMDTWGKWIVQLPKFPVETMPEVVSAAHIVVVPQRDTPEAIAQFPLKLTDAMAMTKPILSTLVGDIPEIVGDTGYLVEPNSPAQIASAIQLIFADLNMANAKGKQARERCLQHYSLDRMATIIEPIINRLNS